MLSGQTRRGGISERDDEEYDARFLHVFPRLSSSQPYHVNVGVAAGDAQQFRIQGVFPVERAVPGLRRTQGSIEVQKDKPRRRRLPRRLYDGGDFLTVAAHHAVEMRDDMSHRFRSIGGS